MAPTPFVIDIDAAIRETSFPDGIPVIFKGNTYMLPAELPLDIFDPFLAEDFDLAGLIKQIGNEGEGVSFTDSLTDLLFNRPTLPLDLIDALKGSLALLFGDQWEAFQAGRPGAVAYTLVIRRAFQAYGVILGEVFKSPSSSDDAGATSKPTPTSISDSTPEPSGDDPEPEPASSESAA